MAEPKNTAAPAEASATPTADELVRALGALLTDIASGLDAARDALRAQPDTANAQGLLVAELLGVYGWMAEHGAHLAGEATTLCGADPAMWLLPFQTRERLKPFESAAAIRR